MISLETTPISRFQFDEKTRCPGHVCNSMRLRMTDHRERMLKALLDATGENTKSKAIDKAVNHYCRCAGANPAHPTGNYEELMERAVGEGSVAPGEIAEILDTESLPVRYCREYSVGE